MKKNSHSYVDFLSHSIELTEHIIFNLHTDLSTANKLTEQSNSISGSVQHRARFLETNLQEEYKALIELHDQLLKELDRHD